MPGKKGHKSRVTENVGMHGIEKHPGHARKSTGQTEGQFAHEKRKGQFGSAGNPPLIKK